MIKSDKTERFGEKELDKLVGLLRLNCVQYISDAVITHGMGRPALALGTNFLLDKPLVNRLFTGAASIEDFLRILDDACFGAGARGPGSLGLAPVVATASFPLINLPKIFILASLS